MNEIKEKFIAYQDSFKNIVEEMVSKPRNTKTR